MDDRMRAEIDDRRQVIYDTWEHWGDHYNWFKVRMFMIEAMMQVAARNINIIEIGQPYDEYAPQLCECRLVIGMERVNVEIEP